LNFFAFDLRKVLIILFIGALPLLSINMQRNPGDEPWYKKPFSIAVGGIQSSYSSFTSGVRGTASMYLKLIGIKKENQDLLKENEGLRAGLGALTELKLENERLNKLLGFKQTNKMELLAAKVIARDLSLDHYSIRINRGLRHGLKKLQAVITVEGVVGYVYRPEEISSQVLVLTDRSAAIDAIVQRTRAEGLVSGKNISSCRLRYLKRADDVALGDMIVTSGLQGYFPKGFPIGHITAVKKTNYGISQEAQVSPIVNPANLEEVFVVLNSGNEDFFNKGDNADFGPPLLSKLNDLRTGTPRLDPAQLDPTQEPAGGADTTDPAAADATGAHQ
jgi:rod shape-determining protein MreC